MDKLEEFMSEFGFIKKSAAMKALGYKCATSYQKQQSEVELRILKYRDLVKKRDFLELQRDIGSQEKAVRDCLRCGRGFLSISRYNRMCQVCRTKSGDD